MYTKKIAVFSSALIMALSLAGCQMQPFSFSKNSSTEDMTAVYVEQTTEENIPESLDENTVTTEEVIAEDTTESLTEEITTEAAASSEDNPSPENTISLPNAPLSPNQAAGQIEVIARNSSLWTVDDEWEQYFYTVTDLDHNGRLEIISASCQGSGFFTYADIFEVNEDLGNLTPVTNNLGEGDAFPDILLDNHTVCYNPTDDTYSYIIRDDIRNGAADNYACTVSMVMKNGHIDMNYLASAHTMIDEAECEDTIYTKGEDWITEEEFNNLIPDTYGASCAIVTFSFAWFDVNSGDLTENLTNAYQQFALIDE